MLVSFYVTMFFSMVRDTQKSPAPFKKRNRDKDAIRQGDAWARHFEEKIYCTSSAYQINEPACDAVMMTECSAFHDILRQYGAQDQCPAGR